MKKQSSFSSTNEFHSIKLVLSDFDGVMTDGRVIVSETGEESVFCNRLDGIGVRILKNHGIETVIISSESNNVVMKRSEKLNITSHGNVSEKKAFVLELIKTKNLAENEVLYIGDEINDYDIMNHLGLTACPSDAHKKIKEISKLKLNSKGGHGVIREIADILIPKNVWK